MFQPTGSVYLDTPRPTRTPPTEKPNRVRASAAGLFGLCGFLALTALVTLGAVRVLLNDPTSIAEAVDASLDDRLVRIEIESELVSAIETSLVGTEVSSTAALFGLDVVAEAETLAPIILDDPAFRIALTEMIADTHDHVLIQSSADPLDLAPMTQAVVAVIERESPELATAIPTGNLLLTINGDQLPDFNAVGEKLDQAFTIAMLVSLALPLAGLIHPRRHKVLAWVGRWLLAMGLVAAVAAVSLPYLAGKASGYALAEVAVRSLTVPLLGPAALAGIVGIGLVATASVFRSRERRRTANEGAAIALGVHEPELIPATSSPQLDLSNRGLVDVSHPLTNI